MNKRTYKNPDNAAKAAYYELSFQDLITGRMRSLPDGDFIQFSIKNTDSVVKDLLKSVKIEEDNPHYYNCHVLLTMLIKRNVYFSDMTSFLNGYAYCKYTNAWSYTAGQSYPHEVSRFRRILIKHANNFRVYEK